MEDFNEWVSLRKANRKFLEPWEPQWSEDEYKRSNFRYRLHIYNKLSQEERSQALFIFQTASNTLIGAINLSHIRHGISMTATLGYWIAEPFARQGLMTEALKTLLVYCFGDLNLNRVEAACLPSNKASIALLKKCGFEQEGYAKSYLKIAGTWQDHLLFSKLNSHSHSSLVNMQK
jgi:[ribosomal protein S5]-alanine N-acetyltransferase